MSKSKILNFGEGSGIPLRKTNAQTQCSVLAKFQGVRGAHLKPLKIRVGCDPQCPWVGESPHPRPQPSLAGFRAPVVRYSFPGWCLPATLTPEVTLVL